VLAKSTPGECKTDEELDFAIRQIISKAIASDEVVDIFAAAGLKKPDISILSDEFLADVRAMPQRNLAVELLQKLLRGEIRTRGKRNVVQARSFAEMLEQGRAQVPEPRTRDGAGDRGADPARQGHARRGRQRRADRSFRG
jgi:type I restriction enzyme R subunit